MNYPAGVIEKTNGHAKPDEVVISKWQILV